MWVTPAECLVKYKRAGNPVIPNRFPQKFAQPDQTFLSRAETLQSSPKILHLGICIDAISGVKNATRFGHKITTKFNQPPTKSLPRRRSNILVYREYLDWRILRVLNRIRENRVDSSRVISHRVLISTREESLPPPPPSVANYTLLCAGDIVSLDGHRCGGRSLTSCAPFINRHHTRYSIMARRYL